jgi:hypothetical protein
VSVRSSVTADPATSNVDEFAVYPLFSAVTV